MSLSPLDALRGTGPLPALEAMDSVVAPLAQAVEAIKEILDKPRGAGTEVLQGYDDDPFLIMANGDGADGDTTGSLVMQWQPPAEAEAKAWDELQKAKDANADASRERVILGATGQPVRVVGV